MMTKNSILLFLMLTYIGSLAQENAKKEEGILKLYEKGHYILGYQYTIKYPPAGIDSVYGRAGFIHPLNTLSGKTLTRIQPPDHYHHYGIWNPWTRVEYKSKVYDLWNLKDKQGTVKHIKFNKVYDKKGMAGFNAKHAHIVYPTPTEEVAVLNEDWEVKVLPIDDKKYSCDINSTLEVVGKDTVTLKEYRYAGLGFRATEQWTNKNSSVVTSSGKDRTNADGSLERWVMVEGTVDGAQAGILFLSHPENFNHPEPIRIWPPLENKGRGDVFVNFAPTKNKDWTLAPDKKYQLKYRLVIFDDTLTIDEAEKLWQAYAAQRK